MARYENLSVGQLEVDNFLGGLPQFPFPHRKLFVDPSGILAPYGLDHVYSTLDAAEEAAIANQHDTVYLVGVGSLNLAAAMTWDKSYTHLIGVCPPTPGCRSRIFQTSTLTSASPLLTISASGCFFQNFYIFQGVDDAGSLINVSVTGSRNGFSGVHFAGGGHATMAIDGGCSLKVAGDENLFKACTIGVTTIASATGHVGLLLAGSDGHCVRNEWHKCRFTMYAGHTGAAWVEVADATAIDRYNIFSKCLFLNDNYANYAMASGFVIPAIAGNRPARLYLNECSAYGATKMEASDRGVLVTDAMPAQTPADTMGTFVAAYA